MKRMTSRLLGSLAISFIGLTATHRADAWTSVYLRSEFATHAPAVTVYVDINTGDVKLVGEPGAVINQYRIASAAGAFDPTQWKGMDATYQALVDSGADLAGTTYENYRYWMPMFNSPSTRYLGDKCCPANDPEMLGVIQFDLLPDHTLDLGSIWNAGAAKGSQSDLTFTYSYGYVRVDTPNELSRYFQNNLSTVNSHGETGDGQLIGDGTFPKPDASFVPAIYKSYFPNGDGVSAIATIVYVPEAMTGALLGAGACALLMKKGRKRA